MKILNLYAGLGGNRTLWSRTHEVTAVEIDFQLANLYQKRFPDDDMINEDVKEVLRFYNVNEFDFIWASPPCRTHSQMQKFNKNRPPIPRMDEVYGLLIWLEWNYKNYYVIENVQPYYKTPIIPTARIDRHIFWANFPIKSRRFREKRQMHGTLSKSHIMRDSREKLIQDFMLTEEIADQVTDQQIRNCVDPRIGKYVLNQLMSMKTLEQFVK